MNDYFNLEPRIYSHFDADNIRFTKQNKDIGDKISNVIKNKINDIHEFKYKINRNSFLYGCLKATEKDYSEHLIIGYGPSRGKSINIEYFYQKIGINDRVDLNDEELGCILLLLIFTSNEFIIFHNHPKDRNNIYNEKPLASMSDREAVSYFTSLNVYKTLLFNKHAIRCFLGENGNVREIKIPSINALLRTRR